MTTLARAAEAYTEEQAVEPDRVSRDLAARGVQLAAEEVTLLLELLGRPPLWPEAVLFGILWSEHCSYKSTRHLLKRLPTEAPHVILGPGEDAGVVALPAPCEDLALVLAHESHNHPSQILPVEGAATGVGGIVRDVGCMGAEVIGCLDSLRFGDPAGSVHARDVIRGVVQGIADYGNALGVPNLGGDTVFASGFDTNCLVNVMALGLVPRDGILRSRVPEGAGPWVFVLAGKPTDESGFGGAAFASVELGGDEDSRGAVQLPDPFLKRVLHVANAEVFRRLREGGIPAGFKDLGAGGVACATSEMAAAGGRGAALELERLHRVPRALPPEVILCAETQERFCWVVPESFAEELCDVYERVFALGDVYPGAGARIVGRASDDRQYRVTWHGETLVDCPVDAITTGRSVQHASRRKAPAAALERSPSTGFERDVLPRLLRCLHLCSREYLFRHYDGEVQGRAWLRPGEADAAVIRVHPEREQGVAFATGGNPFWCDADPELGARHAVAEAARNVACTGARPWALTDCLNFGRPESPEVMGQVEATIDGLAVAAQALGGLASHQGPLPFVSGNVSLYNQVGDAPIPASPIVMCAGVAKAVDRTVAHALLSAGDFLVLVGEPRDELTGSTYAREILGRHGTAPPRLDLEHERRLQDLAVTAAEGRWVRAAHDVSDGGLGIALAEMMLTAPDRRLGMDIDLGVLETSIDAALFCERPAILFEVSVERATRLFQAARERSLLAWPLGSVTSRPQMRLLDPEHGTLEWTMEELREAAGSTLERVWNEEGAET